MAIWRILSFVGLFVTLSCVSGVISVHAEASTYVSTHSEMEKPDVCPSFCKHKNFMKIIEVKEESCTEDKPYCCKRKAKTEFPRKLYCCNDINRRYVSDCTKNCFCDTWLMVRWEVLLIIIGSIIAAFVIFTLLCRFGATFCMKKSALRRRTRSDGDTEVQSVSSGVEPAPVAPFFNPDHPYAFIPPNYNSLPKEPPTYENIDQQPEEAEAAATGFDNMGFQEDGGPSTSYPPPLFSEHGSIYSYDETSLPPPYELRSMSTSVSQASFSSVQFWESERNFRNTPVEESSDNDDLTMDWMRHRNSIITLNSVDNEESILPGQEECEQRTEHNVSTA